MTGQKRLRFLRLARGSVGINPSIAATTVISLAVGAAFGTADAIVNGLASPYRPFGADIDGTVLGGIADVASLVLDSAWAWAAIAFAAGIACRRPSQAVVAGSATLAGASTLYLVVDAWFNDGMLSGREMLYWVGLSLVIGPLVALIGFVARRSDLLGLAGRLVIPAGAALQMVVDPPGFPSAGAGGPSPTMPGAPTALYLVLLAASAIIIAVIVAWWRTHRRTATSSVTQS